MKIIIITSIIIYYEKFSIWYDNKSKSKILISGVLLNSFLN